MNKVIYTLEIVEAIEALPLEFQAEVYALINSYVFRGFLPDNCSAVARAVFLSLKPNFDKQMSRSRPSEPKEDDKTEEHIEKMFAPETKCKTPDAIVERARNYGVNLLDVRKFVEYAHSRGIIYKHRGDAFDVWQCHILNTLGEFARDKLKPSAGSA